MTTHAFAPRFDLSNVFLSSAPDARESEPSFALVKNGPPVAADEVESHVEAVEVTVRWGTQVLAVKHLANGHSFFVGDDSDLALPEDILGASRAPIVVARGGGTYVVVPPGARGHIAMRDGTRESIAGAREIPLAYGMSVTLEVGAERADGTTGEPITFEIGTVRAGKVAPIGFLATLAGGATGFIGLSFLGHAAIVASLAMFMPKMDSSDSDGIDRDQMLLMQKFLNASAESEPEQEPRTESSSEPAGGGSTGEKHQGPEGAAGTDKPVVKPGHLAIKGNEDKSQLSRREELKIAQEFGMAGLLASASLVDPNAPASPWMKDPVKGSSVKSAMGDMFSTDIGDATGTGLGLWSTGEGGGGTGAGVGLDHVNTIGGGGGGGTGPSGFGPGDKSGIGIGHGPGGNGHVSVAPKMRVGVPVSNGRLPAEVIQRIVRQNFGRFRLCYEAGLRGNPGLSGRISTKFVIGRDGAVMQSSDAGSDLPDQQVVACVVRSFNSLSFPLPEGGVATVTYPIILTPGE